VTAMVAAATSLQANGILQRSYLLDCRSSSLDG